MAKMKYDIALSFAGEDREYVEQVAIKLSQSKINVFYDSFEQVDLWGKDLYQHLSSIYKDKSLFTVIFISRNYARKLWTKHELKSAQARAFTENKEYILPVRFDDTSLPGIPDTVGYLNLNQISPEELADIIIEKLKGGNTIHQVNPVKKQDSVSGEKKEFEFHLENVSLNSNIPKILYSVNTKIKFLISERYFNQIHYAWCASYFDISKKLNPNSSNAIRIYQNLLRDVKSHDYHSSIIEDNRAGILKGAKIYFDAGKITKDQFEEIHVIVTEKSSIRDFIPLVYVIPTNGIENLVKEAPLNLRANPFSKEYIIENLHRSMFDIINIDEEFFDG